MNSESYQNDGKQEEEAVMPGLLSNSSTGETQPEVLDDRDGLKIKTGSRPEPTKWTQATKESDEKTAIMTNSRLRSKWFNIYLATLPLAFIFLFDILPSRASLIFIGHLLNSSKDENAVDSLYDFDAMFAAYGFTNFWVVFILSLSCGLDTLSKQQLRNIEYFRHACILVVLGVVPYIVACIYARDILYYILSQPSFIIDKAHNAIQFLIGYCLCYVIFAMLRKSLLQYLNSSLLVGIMFVRLCCHIMIGYFLYEYNSTNLGMYCFAISDSASMIILLIITVVTLTKFVDFKEFIKSLLCITSGQKGGGYKQVMDPKKAAINETQNLSSSQPNAHQTDSQTTSNLSNTTNKTGQTGRNPHNISKSRETHYSASASYVDKESMPAQTWANLAHTSSHDPIETQSFYLFKEYIGAMIIPGAISCLEWWAVEAITWLVGGMSTIVSEGGNIYIYYFVHAIYSSMLLIVQMPMLGLSVAMAAIITADIRLGRFNAAFYTFMQGVVSSLIYCIIIGFIVLYGYNKGLLGIFFDLPVESKLYSVSLNGKFTHEYIVFVKEIYNACESINLFLIVSIVCYSIAMCFLALFVSVGRLAKGGMFMLTGYYIFGLLVSAICGYVLKWHLYGIWFGYACGFVVWCLLSAAYWMCCTKWKNEMKSMKAAYDEIEKYEKGTKTFKQKLHKNYGSISQQ